MKRDSEQLESTFLYSEVQIIFCTLHILYTLYILYSEQIIFVHFDWSISLID